MPLKRAKKRVKQCGIVYVNDFYYFNKKGSLLNGFFILLIIQRHIIKIYVCFIYIFNEFYKKWLIVRKIKKPSKIG